MKPQKVLSDFTTPVGVVTGSRVIDGIAASKNLIIFCGAGVSIESGLPDLRSPNGFWDQEVIPSAGRKRAIRGSDLLTKSEGVEGERLQHLNHFATKRRIDARLARPSSFHLLLNRFMEAGRLRKCVTKNVDGLETAQFPQLAKKVTMVHGDNRVLTCLERSCPDISGEEVNTFDEAFLARHPVPCPSCQKKREAQVRAKKRVTTKVYDLRPSVRWDESLDPEFLIEGLYTSFPQEIEGCDTLLIIGTRPTGTAYSSVVPEIA
ncbi:hypothetical protein FS749_001007 [Ceratobasidium sp. UAMH 11750]|nr:hypothetical protein FS749_001007 [Ceratobasidium sp. UAMH 11750]